MVCGSDLPTCGLAARGSQPCHESVAARLYVCLQCIVPDFHAAAVLDTPCVCLQLRVPTSARAFTASATAATAGGVSGLLHDSKVPTFYFQDSLPRLPIPALNDTLDKYLYFLEPLVSAEQLAATRKHVEAFRAGVGQQLHTHLVNWDKVRAPDCLRG